MFILPELKEIHTTTDNTIYMTIYNDVRKAIIEGELQPNEKLPSKRTLAMQLGVSVKSVENAYNQLLLEGYIYSIEKKGYFVTVIADYLSEQNHSKSINTTKYHQTEYKVNLRSNRSAFKDFPADTWCRLMRETLSEDSAQIFKTVPFNGAFKLRKAIANHLRSFRGMKVSPDQIIIAAGTEYIYSRLMQIFGAEAIYALPDPCSKRLHELYINNRLNYHAIPSSEGLDYKMLNETNSQILHFSPAHQYPLGRVMPIQERIELLKWANENEERYIVEDDYDSEYVLAGKPVPPLYSIDTGNKVIYMNTFSKSVSPAMRISYVVLPEKLMERYLNTMSFYACTVASVEQYTLAKFIERNYLVRFINRANRKNVKLKPFIIGEFEQLHAKKLISYDSDCVGAMILLKLHTKKSDEEIKKALKEHDIITSMMSEYYHNEAEQQKHAHVMVVNYTGLSHMQIEYLCDALEDILGDEGF